MYERVYEKMVEKLFIPQKYNHETIKKELDNAKIYLILTYNVTSLLTLVTSLGLGGLITVSGDMTGTTTVITLLGRLLTTTGSRGTITAHMTSLTTVVTRSRGTEATVVVVTTVVGNTFGTVTRHMARLTASVTSRSITGGGIGTITRLFKFHY